MCWRCFHARHIHSPSAVSAWTVPFDLHTAGIWSTSVPAAVPQLGLETLHAAGCGAGARALLLPQPPPLWLCRQGPMKQHWRQQARRRQKPGWERAPLPLPRRRHWRHERPGRRRPARKPSRASSAWCWTCSGGAQHSFSRSRGSSPGGFMSRRRQGGACTEHSLLAERSALGPTCRPPAPAAPSSPCPQPAAGVDAGALGPLSRLHTGPQAPAGVPGAAGETQGLGWAA